MDSANDSAERTSIDTDFTKMDSSDDGFSTGRELLPYVVLIPSILRAAFYFLSYLSDLWDVIELTALKVAEHHESQTLIIHLH